MREPTRQVRADRGDSGRRLDLVLRRRLTGVAGASRTRIQSWIAAGDVTVNGTPTRRVAARVALGDLIACPAAAQKNRPPPAAEDRTLDILYEDEHLLAVNKPAGIVSHPTYKHPGGTLLNALLWYARGWPNDHRPTLVGRLDRFTSGIVIVAKTKRAHAALQSALRTGDKKYLAVVYGRVHARGVIDLPLARDRNDHRRVTASDPAGSRSVTRFERLARVAAPRVGLSLLECRLETGRMHQIRVHLAARGWPIVGDPTYGAPLWTQVGDATVAGLLCDFPRQALHAWRVAVRHPASGAPIAIEAPLPVDFSDLLASTGLAERWARRPR